MRLWINKPVYELLPYGYIFAGVFSLAAAVYLDFWYWPAICLSVGLICLIGGLVVWLKRRDYRHTGRTPVVEETTEV